MSINICHSYKFLFKENRPACLVFLLFLILFYGEPNIIYSWLHKNQIAIFFKYLFFLYLVNKNLSNKNSIPKNIILKTLSGIKNAVLYILISSLYTVIYLLPFLGIFGYLYFDNWIEISDLYSKISWASSELLGYYAILCLTFALGILLYYILDPVITTFFAEKFSIKNAISIRKIFKFFTQNFLKIFLLISVNIAIMFVLTLVSLIGIPLKQFLPFNPLEILLDFQILAFYIQVSDLYKEKLLPQTETQN